MTSPFFKRRFLCIFNRLRVYRKPTYQSHLAKINTYTYELCISIVTIRDGALHIPCREKGSSGLGWISSRFAWSSQTESQSRYSLGINTYLSTLCITEYLQSVDSLHISTFWNIHYISEYTCLFRGASPVSCKIVSVGFQIVGAGLAKGRQGMVSQSGRSIVEFAGYCYSSILGGERIDHPRLALAANFACQQPQVDKKSST